MNIRDRRVPYETPGLEPGDLAPDPVAQWHRWYDDAIAGGLPEPNAMTLATVAEDGGADARVLLVRGVDEAGLTFFSNYRSSKGRQLDRRPEGAVVFLWQEQHRQVRARGAIVRLDPAESDAYFHSRPRDHQLGAWASDQSAELVDRGELEAAWAAATDRFEGGPVPRPPHWGGWRLVPVRWEFWQGRPNRLHDRFAYERADGGAGWRIVRLSP